MAEGQLFAKVMKMVKVQKLKNFSDFEPELQIIQMKNAIKNTLKINCNKKFLDREMKGNKMTRERKIYETTFDCKISQLEELNNLDKITNHPIFCAQMNRISNGPLQSWGSLCAKSVKRFHQTFENTTYQPEKNSPSKSVILKSQNTFLNERQLTTQTEIKKQQEYQFQDKLNINKCFKQRSLDLKRNDRGFTYGKKSVFTYVSSQNSVTNIYKSPYPIEISLCNFFSLLNQECHTFKHSKSRDTQLTIHTEIPFQINLPLTVKMNSLKINDICIRIVLESNLHESQDNSRQERDYKHPDSISSCDSRNIPLRDTNSIMLCDSITVNARPLSVNAFITTTDLSVKKHFAHQKKNLISLPSQLSSSVNTENLGCNRGLLVELEVETIGNKSLVEQFYKIMFLQPYLHQHLKHLDNRNQLLYKKKKLPEFLLSTQKLGEHKQLIQLQNIVTSNSTTSMEFKDLPFDMPKLKKRLEPTESIKLRSSQKSSDQSTQDVRVTSIRDKNHTSFLLRSKMTLTLKKSHQSDDINLSTSGIQISTKNSTATHPGLSMKCFNPNNKMKNFVNIELPLEKQSWYHGSITRVEAEAVLRLLEEGSYLVRNSDFTKQDYSLSLKSAKGFMHIRIRKNNTLNAYIFGQYSDTFRSVPEIVHHFSINQIPIRGAEHMCLLHPAIGQLL
ncbi:uncharacterized protein LOC106641726 [Copidosoma floridanum]|uniref:uncharacterized protein LOC106641726 n=1 Tax=Copidosoma floridanum TaxID=29053 RepID=UPI0006C94F03|nr:uncharacterized protein LOC106641726 [Copidosoma floridanum]